MEVLCNPKVLTVLKLGILIRGSLRTQEAHVIDIKKTPFFWGGGLPYWRSG